MLYVQSSVSTICDNAITIKESAKAGNKVSSKWTYFSRNSTMECMEKLLSI